MRPPPTPPYPTPHPPSHPTHHPPYDLNDALYGAAYMKAAADWAGASSAASAHPSALFHSASYGPPPPPFHHHRPQPPLSAAQPQPSAPALRVLPLDAHVRYAAAFFFPAYDGCSSIDSPTQFKAPRPFGSSSTLSALFAPYSFPPPSFYTATLRIFHPSSASSFLFSLLGVPRRLATREWLVIFEGNSWFGVSLSHIARQTHAYAVSDARIRR